MQNKSFFQNSLGRDLGTRRGSRKPVARSLSSSSDRSHKVLAELRESGSLELLLSSMGEGHRGKRLQRGPPFSSIAGQEESCVFTEDMGNEQMQGWRMKAAFLRHPRCIATALDCTKVCFPWPSCGCHLYLELSKHLRHSVDFTHWFPILQGRLGPYTPQPFPSPQEPSTLQPSWSPLYPR